MIEAGLLTPFGWWPRPHHPAEAVLAVRLDQHESEPRLFYETDLRPVARS